MKLWFEWIPKNIGVFALWWGFTCGPVVGFRTLLIFYRETLKKRLLMNVAWFFGGALGACMALFPRGGLAQGEVEKAGMQKASPQEKRALRELKGLRAEVQKAADAYYKQQEKEVRKAREAGKPVPKEWRRMADLSSFTPRFFAKAKAYAGKDEAILFLQEILWFDQHKGTQSKVIDTLLRDHVKSEKMESFAIRLGGLYNMIGAENANRSMEALLKNNPHPQVKAAVLWSKVAVLLGGNPEISDAKKKEGKSLLKRILKLAPKSKAAQLAGDRLFSMENLKMGMPAPDIVGKDLNGKPLRLSEFKGKVVMLDFWGDW